MNTQSNGRKSDKVVLIYDILKTFIPKTRKYLVRSSTVLTVPLETIYETG